MIKKAAAVLLVLVMAFSVCGCGLGKENKMTAIYFDTSVTLSAYGKSVPKKAWKLCEKYDKLFSATDKQSDVFTLNTLSCASVDKDTAQLISSSLKYCELSGGKLDITVYPLKLAWGFYGDKKEVPTAEQIDSALKLVNYKNVSVNGNTVTLNNNAAIDLGAVAKGYIADKIADVYKETSTVGIIDLGGNIMLPLKKKNDKPFIIGIKDPKNTNSAIVNLKVESGAVVTSGTYERSFSAGGKKYHHILDVTTGYPAENGIASATVISETALSADALSTAVVCMGKDDGLKLINSLSDTYAVIITDDNEIILSDGLKNDGEYIVIANG